MTFDEWARSERTTYTPTDDSVEDRKLRRCWDAAVSAERERIINALPGGDSVDPQWVADMVRNEAVAAERERWRDVVLHAVRELEVLDDETAQVQANALRELCGPNVGIEPPKVGSNEELDVCECKTLLAGCCCC
jgi:hypothetical protein